MLQQTQNKAITAEVLFNAFTAAKMGGIPSIVVASTTGCTARVLISHLDVYDGNVIVVTHGGERGRARFDSAIRNELTGRGVSVFTQMRRMQLPGIVHRFMRKFGLSSKQRALKRIKADYGTGISVCHKIIGMSVKHGLIKHGKVVAVAGTNCGADSAGIFEICPVARFPTLLQVIVAPAAKTTILQHL